jgi:superfamily II DNA or RNA helicase
MPQTVLDEILFSRSTFQGVCLEGKDPYYPLIQLGEDNLILSAICSCGSDENICKHAKLLYEKVITPQGTNLSEEYEKSFIKAFFTDFFSVHEESDIKLHLGASTLKGDFGEDSLEFSGPLKDLKEIKTLLSNDEIKDETNSLEFSSLPENELYLYQNKRPSFDFRFRLSVYNDLAKYLFLKQDLKKAHIVIKHIKKAQWELDITVFHLKIKAQVSSEVLQDLVPEFDPSLTKTPLYQGCFDQKIELHFDPKNGELMIDKKKQKLPSDKLIDLGDFVFLPEVGFFSKELDPIFNQNKIEDVPVFFKKYRSHINQLLHGVQFHPQKEKAHYKLEMKDAGLLTISLDKAGEILIDANKDHLFNPYILIKKNTLIELDGVLFDELVKVIPKESLKTFLNRHRHFLKDYPGFEWHMASVQENLDYVFNGKELEFIQKKGEDNPIDFIDCGEFIYIPQSGFYPKVSLEGGAKIVSGLKVPKESLESFLNENRADLALIKGFFCHHSPLENVILSIELSDKGSLKTTPVMVLKKGFTPEKVLWLGSYTYTYGMGFKEVPTEFKLPVLFAHPARFGLHELFGLLDVLQSGLKDRLKIDSRLKIPDKIELNIEEITHEKPYLATGFYSSSLGRCPLSFIKKAYEKGERSVCSDAGLIDLTDERFGFLKHLTLNKEGLFSLDALSFYKLSLYEQMVFSQSLDEHPFIKSLNVHEDNAVLDLKGYTSSLRPYQETGVRWLQNLFRLGLSGLLCDEMGLGKTHQAIAFIAVLSNQKPHVKTLVVCPTSVLYHWERQLKNFLPHQKVHLFHGQARSFNQQAYNDGIILTSYGVLRSDYELFSQLSFDLAIFDELQIAKNPHSKIYAALSKIQTLMKIGLSGTPIENTIEDLKVLFDLILPKLLPKTSEFKEKFLIPIEKNYDKKARERLNRVTAPFIMRRLKKDVLKDLPEKVETDMLCHLSDYQEHLYHKIVQEQKASLMNMVESNKEGTLHIFALLTKLKQLCDHPALIETELDPYKEEMSGKWDLFVELLQEARDSGQKVVVFSQYLGMLNIIEKYLKEHNIGYSSLRGSSMDRSEQVRRFQEDPTCEVFVGSLLASGVGIDLTAASVVIHYDRWWNPAKEAQATDRVHRIGQNRGVQVFKLITKDTIEERIDWLIKDKLRLIDTLNTDEGPDLFKNFSKKELIELVESLS